MEKNSIGTYIAILRRVKGMTQKDLADRLGVSDKTVSHWERDESAPDLTLIPIIADVFGITCDELLRGEKIMGASEKYSGKEPEKTEKQAKYLPDMSRRFKRRSMVSLSLSIAGLFAAMLFNFGSHTAYVAFLIGCIFYMAAAICESIFYSYALCAAGGNDSNGTEINDYKMYVVNLAGKVMSVSAIMFAISLALVIFPYSSYQGIDAGQWIGWSLVAAPAAVAACMFIVYIVNNALIKKGVYTLIKSTDIKRHRVSRLKVMCITVTAAILLALFAGQMLFNGAVRPEAFTSGTTFDNFDDFKAYAETGDVNERFRNHYSPVFRNDYGPQPISGATDVYYDEYGNQISKEQALADYVQALTEYIYDGAGNVVCQYVRLNEEVAEVRYSVTDAGKFSVTAYNHSQWNAGSSARDLINIAWAFLYFAAAGAAFLVYFKKRVKLG